MKNSKYKIGLFGELISESSLNSILEQDFDFDAAASVKTAKPSTVNTTTKKVASPATAVSAKGEFTATIIQKAKEIDTLCNQIFESLQTLFKTRSEWSGYTGYINDDELLARKEMFGVDTQGKAHPTQKQSEEGFRKEGTWWYDNCYRKYKNAVLRAEEIFSEINKKYGTTFSIYGQSSENVTSSKISEVMKDFIKTIYNNLYSVRKVYFEIVEKMNRGMMTGSNKQIVNIRYLYLYGIIDPSSKDLTKKYSFSTDF